MSAPTDSEIIEALPSSGEARGLRELTAQLGTTSRKLGVRVERLAELGKLLIDRPTGGYRSGERQIRRDGDTVESLRVRLAAAQARSAALLTAAEQAVSLLNSAIHGATT